jgi:hypothetical protein
MWKYKRAFCFVGLWVFPAQVCMYFSLVHCYLSAQIYQSNIVFVGSVWFFQSEWLPGLLRIFADYAKYKYVVVSWDSVVGNSGS